MLRISGDDNVRYGLTDYRPTGSDLPNAKIRPKSLILLDALDHVCRKEPGPGPVCLRNGIQRIKHTVYLKPLKIQWHFQAGATYNKLGVAALGATIADRLSDRIS